MIRTTIYSTLLMIACFLLQSTYLHSIAILGIIPDLSLILLVFTAVKNGSFEGQISGFSSGIVEDFLSASPLGYHTFIRTFLGFIYGFLYGNFFVDAIFVPFILTFVSVLAKALFAIFLHLFFTNLPIYNFFDKDIWIHAGYTATIAPIIFLILGLFKSFLITKRNRI